MILAIDFDGVIHDYSNPVPGRKMGPPITGAKEAINTYKNRGDRIIVFCLWGDRKGQETISKWMKYYQIPFDEVTNIKPAADIYIDDKALRFEDWNTTNNFLQQNLYTLQ